MKTFKQYINENEEIDNQELDNSDIPEIFYPEGVYISVKLSEETETLVKEYQEKYLKGQDINEELHCTLIYSKKPHVEEIEPGEYTAIGTFQEFSLFGPDENILVVEVNSQDLFRRNEELVQEYKFISDFDEYKSHITLSYGVENIDLNSLPPMDFAFKFQDEAVEPLNTNWAGDDDDTGEDGEGTLVGKALAKQKNKKEKSEDDKNKKEDDERSTQED